MMTTTTMVRKKTFEHLYSSLFCIFLTSIVKRIPQKEGDDDSDNDGGADSDNDGNDDSDEDDDDDENPGLSALYDNGEIEEDEEDAAVDFEPGSDDEEEGIDDSDGDEDEDEPDSKRQKTE